MRQKIKEVLHYFMQKSDDRVEYTVKPLPVIDGKNPALNAMTFPSRELAREYKSFLRKAFPAIRSKIIRREYIDDRIASEREVW
jgi:hypothetical protein